MKEKLCQRIAELSKKIEQTIQDLNVMRGQKNEAEAMLQHLMNEAMSTTTPVTPTQPETVEH